MQCPPTRPGLYFKKFHLVPAASKTSFVSIPILSKINANSFTNEIFTSRCAFSIALDASATLRLGALWVPASIMLLYSSSTISATSGVDPEVTFLILVNVLILSPGLIRSGE